MTGRKEPDAPGTFPDHFSSVSSNYAAHRPHYPPELFAHLASLVPIRERAWDAGTGSGQSAVGLAPHFKEIVATDASREQLASAVPHDRVTYRVANAAASGLAAGSVDLITASAAAHWFPHDAFHEEARRVAREHAVIALWTYTWSIITPEVDALVRVLAREILAGCWPPERSHVDSGYRELPFPFDEIPAPPFAIHDSWTAGRYLGYLGTWSSVQRYRREKGDDPLAFIEARFRQAWGGSTREVTWPLVLRLGRVH